MLQKWLTVNVSGSHAICPDFQSSVVSSKIISMGMVGKNFACRKKGIFITMLAGNEHLRTFLITLYVNVFHDSLYSVINPDLHKS
jgi:hypothetical protein